MSDDAVHEDDEPIEDLRAAWNAGEKGVTSGPRDLNQRARSIVDRAVARFEERQEVRLRVVASGTAATTQQVLDPGEVAVLVERVEDEMISASVYRVG